MDNALVLKKLWSTVYIGLGNYVDDEVYVGFQIVKGDEAARVTIPLDEWEEIIEYVREQVIEHKEIR